MVRELVMVSCGENKEERPRSTYAVQLAKDLGCDLLISGGYSMFAPDVGKTLAERTADYVCQNISRERVYCDGRALETWGDSAFPFGDPLFGNTGLEDFEVLHYVTEENHMPRAYPCLTYCVPEEKVEKHAVEGDYNPGLVTAVYSAALLRRARGLQKGDAKGALKFLQQNHPVYKEEWLEKSHRQRQVTLLTTMIPWLVGLKT